LKEKQFPFNFNPRKPLLLLMKKRLIAFSLTLLCFTAIVAQEKNPLINSGEVINEGIKLYDAGKYKDALTEYKKINRSDTNYVWALYELALTYSADSQYAAAIHTCQLAMAEKTDAERMPDLLTEYGSLLDNIGETEKSIHIFDSALQIYPAYSMLYLNKGTTLLRAKRFKEAEQVFQQAIMQDPYAASSHFKLGIVAMQTGKLVPAMFSFMNYLLISPDGRYSNNCISLLSAMAKNTDEIKEYIDNRTEEPAEEYKLAEQIIQSKIALDKKYKPIIELDDPISRQIQVLLEKLPYASDSKDFWMQYYVPFYKNVFTSSKFEDLINYLFSGVNVPAIQNYNKKKKKDIQALIEETVVYYNKIRSTRQLNAGLRNTAENTGYYESGKFAGIGKRNAKGDKFSGDWKFTFPAGNIKSAGRFTDDGQKDGVWTYYFPNGNIKAKQTFSNGKQSGNETFYFSNGRVSSEADYKEDNLEAAATSYYYPGNKNVTARYIKGKLNGERKQHYSNGSLRVVENYTDDKLNGKYASFYKNGLPEAEATYVNGLIEGPYKTWHPNGKLSAEGEYTKDKATGNWKKYHENGKLKSTQEYVNGKEEGEYAEYYDNGQLFTKYNYKKGVINGEISYNDDDGKLFSVIVFEDNKIISAKYLDKSGKESGTSVMKDKKLDLVSFFADGAKKMTASYNNKGNTEGTETYFYHCGKVSQTNQYSNGQLNGTSTNYFLNDKKSSEVTYENDKKNGYYISYYQHGQVESEGWYKENSAQGQWLNYDEMGNLSVINYFQNDELNGHKDEFYVNGQKEYDTKYHYGWLEEMIQYDTAGKEINRLKMDKGSGSFWGLHFNGKLKFEGNYVLGDFEGPYKFYFFDGSNQVTQFYKKGESDSIYRSYYYGGKTSIEGQYKLGKKAGTWKYYRKGGTLSSIEEYLDGEMSGQNISYYENGKTDLDITYKDGARNGYTKKYEPGGNLVYQINYKNNLPQGYTYFGKDGKLVPEIPFTAGSGQLKSYYPNGQLATDHAYKEGKIDGTYKIYYPNGKVWKEREDRYDITNGPAKEYYENGQIKTSYLYLNDNVQGPFKEYNAKGLVKEEGNYYNGSYHGDIKFYDDNGKLTETDTYYYGRLVNAKK
jgi:uncharacterized protein